ncbi:conserved Plasmodium protein, unknown function [Plasmodium berghei]|uniref:Uncharacterized protein n=2 Tax=Plasmodium berghei TaxID=5821 RepID=A0A509AH01_PLABA|nr:conserved Plasmodium protein, unknown function [Plasmodium berghei ANKA]CXH92917.1 conserved Plasmodium protein, unknown function [Plasmodium berghei]SCL90731.1 conserved Plasmodium protein, unknown function [Plasmodium berghei]SCM15341.1 conserved Plasmodium protein, unknown function [Plasmodium berghei]SCM17134.1 conserved Plasmodium protein, unknown function [Plasmodium berghei]SCN22137.1 conserved Plasmodium protein, unknown function [Plasmodium berghei]|eukprot:XP_034419925.1 conserved Plasmodium protein, unknown function [Plasmodium berghei ANKA]
MSESHITNISTNGYKDKTISMHYQNECEKNEYNKYVLDICNVSCRNITRENNISKNDQEKIQKNYILNTLEDVTNIYNMQNKNNGNDVLNQYNKIKISQNDKSQKGMKGSTKPKSVKKMKGKLLTNDPINIDNFSITNEKIENKFVDNNNGNVSTFNGGISNGINNIIDGNNDNKILKYYDNLNNNQASNNLLRNNENFFNTKMEINNPVLHIVGNIISRKNMVPNIGANYYTNNIMNEQGNNINFVKDMDPNVKQNLNQPEGQCAEKNTHEQFLTENNINNMNNNFIQSQNVGNCNSSDIDQGINGNNNQDGSNKISPYSLNSVNLNMLNKKYNYSMNNGNTNTNTNVLKLIYRNDKYSNIKNGDSPLYLINDEYNKNMNRNNTSSNSTKSSSNHSTNSIISFRGVNNNQNLKIDNNEKNSNNLKNVLNRDNYGYVEPTQNSSESFRSIINAGGLGTNIKNVGNLKHSNNISQAFKINNNENVRNVGIHMIPNGLRNSVTNNGVNNVVNAGISSDITSNMVIHINPTHPNMANLDTKNNCNREIISSKSQQNNITDFEGSYKNAKELMHLHDNNMNKHKSVDVQIKTIHQTDGKLMADSIRNDTNSNNDINRIMNMAAKIKSNVIISNSANINSNNNFGEYQREINNNNNNKIKMSNVQNAKNEIVNDMNINNYMYGNKLNTDIRNDNKIIMKDITRNRKEYLVEPYKKLNHDNYNVMKNILFNRSFVNPQIVNGSYISNYNMRRNSSSSVASNMSNNSNVINYGNIFYLDNKVGFKNIIKPNDQLCKDISILSNTKNKSSNELLKKNKKIIITKHEVKSFLVNTIKAIGCILKKWKKKKMGIYFWFHIQCIEGEKDLNFYINIFNSLFEIITGKNIYYQHNDINNIINIFKEFILYDCKHIFKKSIKILNHYAKKNSNNFSIFGNIKEDLLNVNKSLLLNEYEKKSFLTLSNNLVTSTGIEVQNDINNFENHDNKKNNFLEYLFNSMKDNYYSLEKNNTGKLYLSNMFTSFSELNYNEIFNVFLKQPN